MCSAVEGTEVTLDASLFDRLFWSIRCTPGAEPAVQSKYTYYWNEQPWEWSWDIGDLYVSLFNMQLVWRGRGRRPLRPDHTAAGSVGKLPRRDG